VSLIVPEVQLFSPMLQQWLEEGNDQQPFNDIAQVLVETASAARTTASGAHVMEGCANRCRDSTHAGVAQRHA
jgi:hypothetical protein